MQDLKDKRRTESGWRRGWRDYWIESRIKHIFPTIIGFAFGVILYRQNATDDDLRHALKEAFFLGGLAFVGAEIVLLAGCLVMAPYRQRNDARKIVEELDKAQADQKKRELDESKCGEENGILTILEMRIICVHFRPHSARDLLFLFPDWFLVPFTQLHLAGRIASWLRTVNTYREEEARYAGEMLKALRLAGMIESRRLPPMILPGIPQWLKESTEAMPGIEEFTLNARGSAVMSKVLVDKPKYDKKYREELTAFFADVAKTLADTDPRLDKRTDVH